MLLMFALMDTLIQADGHYQFYVTDTSKT